MTGIPLQYAFLTGNISFWIEKLHNEHGDVVRISPNELSFNTAQSFQDIYGFRQGHAVLQKDKGYYFPPAGSIDDLLTAEDADHFRMRKLLEPAFSSKALRAMDPVITSFTNLLIEKLREQALHPEKEVVDILQWFNWTTFDVVGELTYGQSFGCLDEGVFHPWIKTIFQGLKIVVYFNVCRRIPWLFAVLKWLTPSILRQKRMDHYNFAAERARQRLAREVHKPDFLTYVSRDTKTGGMSTEEIEANCALLLIAGSETTATVLSGAIFFLLNNPEKRKILVDEIRGAFRESQDINTISVFALPYLSAVLSESLRMYPPVPIGLPRLVPEAGDTISGYWVPGTWSTYHSTRNFTEPYSFLPERWLSNRDSRFINDQHDALQPFSVGPRNCIGKNLGEEAIAGETENGREMNDQEICHVLGSGNKEQSA
ncbi:Cytochrome P450 monooxygenase aclL [Lachnellula suecica]|uniref:Cytochrome P450 monooxygenase aclL n=1 Tax=Lachnellula suecica TaxID=602035 RepID=A0A8T9CND1_9HELO|nr:Cytochrome P450 monooxygenase aclL [Lachnellula suecica]